MVASIQLAGRNEPGERLLLQGTVFKPDGRTPAPNVVIYIHQTNAAGRYAGGSNESEWSSRHGQLRGWLKTGADGRYEVTTIKPGQYPDRPSPAHIHLTVLEQGKDPYWIDDVVFDGAPGVDAEYRREAEKRGGAGIVRLEPEPSGGWLAKRDIILLAH
jgi:protocatechuate 3,4-dioxygenase beta subunit